jgi:hypothetical protein
VEGRAEGGGERLLPILFERSSKLIRGASFRYDLMLYPSHMNFVDINASKSTGPIAIGSKHTRQSNDDSIVRIVCMITICIPNRGPPAA